MKETYKKFLVIISVNKINKTGIILTTSAFFTFIFLEISRTMGFVSNAYVGLVTYLFLPMLFITGLLLIPFGWWLYKRKTKKTTKEIVAEKFQLDDHYVQHQTTYLFKTLSVLTIVNIVFLTFASYRTFKFMDQAYFCGNACHDVMGPEWATYVESPHSNVKCIDCHVGESFEAVVSSKMNGVWQMISTTFNLYERPIPAPVTTLRPARETCEKCHWPDKFYGTRLKTIPAYSDNETNDLTYTTLNLKIDSGTKRNKAGIHWHISKDTKVEYLAADEKRNEMIWVKVTYPNGKSVKYVNADLENKITKNEVKTMDCVDCHNRATHVYEDASHALNKKLYFSEISNTLPYIKKIALENIEKNYPSHSIASAEIKKSINKYYKDNYPDIYKSRKHDIDHSIESIIAVYKRNIHPNMNVTWGTYTNHLGHQDDNGCLRCHNSNLVSKEGLTINEDCTLCHSILAMESTNPYQYLKPVENETDVNEEFRDEFLNSIKK